MEKDKERRYQSAGEVSSELEKIEKGIPTTERVVPKRKPITSKEITVKFGLKKLFIPALMVIAIAIIGMIIWRILPQEQHSIAVLPFTDLSPQKNQEVLCDGMTDEIIAKLSRLQGWKVMNRASVMRYKNTEKDVKDIGRELDVATILLGSVRKEKDDIRVTAQLVSVGDRFQIWSDTYEQKLERIFDIQSDVAGKIAKALKAKLSSEEKERLEKSPTENLEAYNLYLKGRYFWNKRTEEGIQEAIKFFRHAIEKDPNYALAYSGLADCYYIAAYYYYIPLEEALQKAKATAIKALEIDETLSEAYATLAGIKLYFDWDWDGSRRDFERAIQLNPSYGSAHQWYAVYLTVLGRPDEAITEAKRAREVDPLSPVINQNVGRRLYFAGRYDQAIEESKKALKIAPEFFPTHRTLGLAYLAKGMFSKAIEELEKAVNLSGGSLDPLIRLGYTYALTDNQAKAKQILNNLKERSKEEHIPSIAFAIIYSGLNDKDHAFEWLNKAFEERSNELVYLKIHPFYDSLRSDPRFTALLKKMGLEK